MPILHLSRAVVLAFQAVVAIAMEGDEKPVATKDMKVWLGHQARATEPALQALVKSGILESRRGLNGGYALAMKPKHITFRHIAECVGDTQNPADLAKALGYSSLAERVMRPAVMGLIEQWNADLEDLTVAEMVDRAKAAKVRF